MRSLLPALYLTLFASGLFASSLLASGEAAQVQLRALMSPEVAALSAQPPRGGHLGLLVRDLDTGQVVEALRPDELFTPASTTKLLSMATWLSLQGPASWYSTDITGPANEVSRSSSALSFITLRGSGDPSLSVSGSNSLAALARQLFARGVRSVGEVRLSGSIDSASWPALPLGTPVVSVRLQEYPGWSLSVDEYQAQVGRVLSAQLRAAGIRVGQAGGQFGRRSAQAAVEGLKPAQTPFTGQTPPTGQPQTAPAAQTSTAQLSAPQITTAAPQPELGLATVRSAPMSTLLRQTLKPSDNVWTEQLAASLGAGLNVSGERPASRSDMLAAQRRFLAQSGAQTSSVKLNDASGLRSDNRLSPRALVSVLRRMYDLPTLAPADLAAKPPLRPAQAFALRKNLFIEALAQGGTGQASADARESGGTLAGRFIGSGLDVRAKTGTLPGVTCLAGYVRGASGHTLAFAVMIDQAPGSSLRLRNYVDQLVRVIAARH